MDLDRKDTDKESKADAWPTSSSTNCCTLLTPFMLGGLFFSHQGSFGGLRLAETTKLLQERAKYNKGMFGKHFTCRCKTPCLF